MIYLKLFLTFLKIGVVGFGGGLAILPLIYQGVNRFAYISEQEFANLFGISQATPGPIGINAATFVGYKVAGVGGALAATLGAILPALILVAITMSLFSKYREHDIVKGTLTGIRPATIGLIGSAVLYVAKGSIFESGFDIKLCQGIADFVAGINPLSLFFAVLAMVLMWKTKLGVIKIIILLGILGALSVLVI